MEIQIKQHKFTLSEPYRAGQTLAEVEAQQLNSLRAMYIQSNVSKFYQKLWSADSPMPDDLLAQVREKIELLDANYQFKNPAARVKQKKGTVEYEAEQIAEERLEARLRQTGERLSSPDWDATIQAWAEEGEIRELAKARLAAQQQITESALEDLL